ncbi:MAG: SDR family NAD(P)-dependent oxidoreductase [Anaerolineae bacterium]|nr:SDR family NAD(P)-dependent oxidoreductase [Anaerolineae bacterium]
MKSYVLITGASGGLGKAFVSECALRGWDLFLTDLHERPLQTIAQGSERQYNVKVLTYTADLTNPESRARLWDHVHRMGLRFHFLINVAGIDFEGGFAERPVEELQTILRLNIENTVEMMRRILTYRDATRPLHIINVSSLASFYPMPLKATYAASKRFLLDLSIALNRELHAGGVTVTALCPAGLPTTSGCIEKIDAQGVMGYLTTQSVGKVARRTVRQALRGRAVVIPGVLNRALRILGGMFPAPVVARVVHDRWRNSREKLASAPIPAPGCADSTAHQPVKETLS